MNSQKNKIRIFTLIAGVLVAMIAGIIYLQSIQMDLGAASQGARLLISLVETAEDILSLISRVLPERQL